MSFNLMKTITSFFANLLIASIYLTILGLFMLALKFVLTQLTSIFQRCNMLKLPETKPTTSTTLKLPIQPKTTKRTACSYYEIEETIQDNVVINQRLTITKAWIKDLKKQKKHKIKKPVKKILPKNIIIDDDEEVF